MKNYYLIILFCLSCVLGIAQTNDISIYTEKGEEFTLFVNGIKQNSTPQSNVKAKDINGNSYALRLVFSDNSIPELTSNQYTEAKNIEIVLAVKQNKKGKYVVRWVEETPKKKENPVVAENNTATYEDPTQYKQNNNESTVVTETVVTTVTSESKPSSQENNNININTGINAGDESFGLNMSISENNINMSTGTESENINFNISINGASKAENIESSSNVTTTTTITTTTTNSSTIDNNSSYSEVGNSPKVESRCSSSMSTIDFNDAVNSIKSKTYNESKLTLAKQICKNSCMTSEQIRDLNKLFDFEDTRLEFAKYAYDFVYDSSKYYKVNDSFTYEHSISELTDYIESK